MSDETRGRNEDGKLLYCSFCGKSQHEVRKLIAGPSVFICDECVELCNDIIREELEDRSEQSDSKLPTPKEIKAILDEYVIGQHRQEGPVGRGLQSLQAAGKSRRRARQGRYRAREEQYPADRADRLRQDAAGRDARPAAERTRSRLPMRRR